MIVRAGAVEQVRTVRGEQVGPYGRGRGGVATAPESRRGPRSRLGTEGRSPRSVADRDHLIILDDHRPRRSFTAADKLPQHSHLHTEQIKSHRCPLHVSIARKTTSSSYNGLSADVLTSPRFNNLRTRLALAPRRSRRDV